MTKLIVIAVLAISMFYAATGTRDFMSSVTALHVAQIERAVDGGR